MAVQRTVERPKCLITATFTEEALARLSQRVDVIYEDWRKTGRIYFGDELADKINENKVEILVVEADQVTADVIEGTNLRFIGACRGTPYAVDVAAATAKGIPVVHAPGRNSQAVAELTIGLMVALLRKLVYAQRMFMRGVSYETNRDFQDVYNALEGGEIHGKKVGIIGLGDIGTRVAKILLSFGASILVYDPYVSDDKILSAGGKRVTLNELVKQSDIITLHVRLTDETYHIIGKEEISMMKPSAVIINTSSPGTVDDQALLEALRQGRIAGAALDVQENEPVDSSNPFLELDNAIVTPHIGGNTRETVERQSDLIVGDLFRFLNGDKPLHLLNPEIYQKSV
ncbi:MAG: hypothetical protein FGF48_09615 [Candidatus Brockarchaeota archaeon]|nr:hypothetical protein [Candidatus Brockarchaeota archaeon]